MRIGVFLNPCDLKGSLYQCFLILHGTGDVDVWFDMCHTHESNVEKLICAIMYQFKVYISVFHMKILLMFTVRCKITQSWVY